MRVAHLVRVGLAVWILRWLALELASRAGQHEPRRPPPDGPLPGAFPPFGGA